MKRWILKTHEARGPWVKKKGEEVHPTVGTLMTATETLISIPLNKEEDTTRRKVEIETRQGTR